MSARKTGVASLIVIAADSACRMQAYRLGTSPSPAGHLEQPIIEHDRSSVGNRNQFRNALPQYYGSLLCDAVLLLLRSPVDIGAYVAARVIKIIRDGSALSLATNLAYGLHPVPKTAFTTAGSK